MPCPKRASHIEGPEKVIGNPLPLIGSAGFRAGAWPAKARKNVEEPDKAAVGAGLALPEKGVENRGPEEAIGNPLFWCSAHGDHASVCIGAYRELSVSRCMLAPRRVGPTPPAKTPYVWR